MMDQQACMFVLLELFHSLVRENNELLTELPTLHCCFLEFLQVYHLQVPQRWLERWRCKYTMLLASTATIKEAALEYLGPFIHPAVKHW